MVRADRCCVGPCNNNKVIQNKIIKMDHVTELKWHRFPTNNAEKMKKTWVQLISKGRADFALTR